MCKQRQQQEQQQEQDPGTAMSISTEKPIGASSDDDDYDKASYLQLTSRIIFFIASCLYVSLACLEFQDYKLYEDYPVDVMYATDDVTWMNYFNETGQIPDYLYSENATDDMWGTWYNQSFPDYGIDDTVFTVPNGKNALVTQYMIIYFCAAVGFFLVGSIEVYLHRYDYWGRILYMVMVLAAFFGIVSSLLVEKDPQLSTIMNLVSVHLFALEAISIIIQSAIQRRKHISYHNRGENYIRAGNVCFLLGTCGDVVLSYFYVLELATLPCGYMSIVSACFWWFSSALYLSVVSNRLWYDRRHGKDIDNDGPDGYNNNNNHKKGDDDKKLDGSVESNSDIAGGTEIYQPQSSVGLSDAGRAQSSIEYGYNNEDNVSQIEVSEPEGP